MKICSERDTLKSDPIKLHINNDINRIPFHVRKKVEEFLKLEKLDIEKVEGPTPWISPIVVVPMINDSIRTCIDIRLPNQANEVRDILHLPLMIQLQS